MNFDWVIAPVTQAAILGAGLLGSLAIWISAKRETRAAFREIELLRVSTETTIKDLTAHIQEMRAEPAIETQPAPTPIMNMTMQGFNLTTRTKVLRMHRRGETASSIAAALGVQHEEVDLLVKLDQMFEAPAVCSAG
jgi:hypothetical protein